MARPISWVSSCSSPFGLVSSTTLGDAANTKSVERLAQPLDRFALAVGDPGEYPRGGFGPEALRLPILGSSGALGDQAFEGAVGVGSRQASVPRNGIPSPGAVSEEDLVDAAFGRGEAEGGEVEYGHA